MLGPKLEELTKEQLVDELRRWHDITPQIIQMSKDLMLYRQYGKTPEELDANICLLRDQLSGTIELQNRQISEMMDLIQQLREDPLGLDKQRWAQAKANTRLQ